HVCAEVRQIFLEKAPERLGTDVDALKIEDGPIRGPGKVTTSYWELADDVSLERDATADVVAKPVARRALAGSSVQRIDIPDKVFAQPRFLQDCAPPGTLHGRVLRPEFSGARLVGLKEDGTRSVAGLVCIV